MNAKRGPIGLDIGARSISAIQLSRARTGFWKLEAASKLTRPVPDLAPAADELRDVAATLDRQGFVGNRVIVVAPEAVKFSATLELPPRTSGAPIEELARQELARTAKRDPASIEVGCWDVPAPPRTGDSTHLLAVGLPHQDAESLIDALEAGGFQVEALECRCCAMVRACAAVAGSTPQVSAIVDIADAATSIAVIHSGTVAYDRPVIETGLSRLREQLQQELRIEAQATDFLLNAVTSGEEKNLPESSLQPTLKIVDDYLATVVQELRSVMAYAIHRYPGHIGPVLLVGPGAGLHGLKDRIRTDLDLEARIVTPRDSVSASGLTEMDRFGADPALTTSVGMAMRRAARSARRAA